MKEEHKKRHIRRWSIRALIMLLLIGSGIFAVQKYNAYRQERAAQKEHDRIAQNAVQAIVDHAGRHDRFAYRTEVDYQRSVKARVLFVYPHHHGDWIGLSTEDKEGFLAGMINVARLQIDRENAHVWIKSNGSVVAKGSWNMHSGNDIVLME